MVKHVKEDEAREHRIAMEAVVDAYDEIERAMGWYYSTWKGNWLSHSKPVARPSMPFLRSRWGKWLTYWAWLPKRNVSRKCSS